MDGVRYEYEYISPHMSVHLSASICSSVPAIMKDGRMGGPMLSALLQ